MRNVEYEHQVGDSEDASEGYERLEQWEGGDFTTLLEHDGEEAVFPCVWTHSDDPPMTMNQGNEAAVVPMSPAKTT